MQNFRKGAGVKKFKIVFLVKNKSTEGPFYFSGKSLALRLELYMFIHYKIDYIKHFK